MSNELATADGETLEIKKIGNSAGLILPKSLLARLRLEIGDVLHVVDQPERGFKATPYDPKHARALAIARKAFKDYAETYRELAKMTEPEWLTLEIVLDAHGEQLALFGGKDGVRDLGLLESALSRAPNKWGYGETSLTALAAAYGFGLSRNHPFIDGNKRTALTAIIMFLGLNDIRFMPTPVDASAAMLALAAGEIEEDMLAKWIADSIVP